MEPNPSCARTGSSKRTRMSRGWPNGPGRSAHPPRGQLAPMSAPLQFLLLLFAGWVNRRQQAVIDDLIAENGVLREQLRGRGLRFSEDQRRRLARKGRLLVPRARCQEGGRHAPSPPWPPAHDDQGATAHRPVRRREPGLGHHPGSRSTAQSRPRCRPQQDQAGPARARHGSRPRARQADALGHVLTHEPGVTGAGGSRA